MQRFPGRILGYAHVNPGYGAEAIEEVRRCVEDRDFVGIKLYNDYVVSEPVVWPLIELAIQLRVPSCTTPATSVGSHRHNRESATGPLSRESANVIRKP